MALSIRSGRGSSPRSVMLAVLDGHPGLSARSAGLPGFDDDGSQPVAGHGGVSHQECVLAPRLKLDGKVAVLEVRADPAQLFGQPDAPGRLAAFVGEEPSLAGLRLGRVLLRSQRIAGSQPYSLKWRFWVRLPMAAVM
jgi:hypothetical protein